MRIVDYQNIHQLLKKTVDTKPDTTAYRWFLDSEGTSESVTWAEFLRQVKQVGKGLMPWMSRKTTKVIILSLHLLQMGSDGYRQPLPPAP